MAWTQSDLDAIETAIANETQSVQFNGRTIAYRSTMELLKARDVIKAAVEAGAGESSRDRVSVAIHDRR